MDRRQFIRNGSLGLLAFTVGGTELLLTPREARAREVPFQVLSADEVKTLEALGEVLLPGAAEAGISHYVDHQLAAPPEDSLLILRYLDFAPPYAPFYHGVLAAADGAARAAHDVPFHELDDEQRHAFVTGMSAGTVADWQGPPAGLAYFVLRNDAVDVVYGTVEGFEKLGFPYMPHIVPPEPW